MTSCQRELESDDDDLQIISQSSNSFSQQLSRKTRKVSRNLKIEFDKEDDLKIISQSSSNYSQEQSSIEQKDGLLKELCNTIIAIPEGPGNSFVTLLSPQIVKMQSLCEKILLKCCKDRKLGATGTEIIHTDDSESDMFHTPRKQGKYDLPSKSPNSGRSSGKQPFTEEECIILLNIVLRYLQDEECKMEHIVELVRNKDWKKPLNNSLATQYNAEAEVQRCGESLKTKFKWLLRNKPALSDLIESPKSVEKLITLREYYDAITCARK